MDSYLSADQVYPPIPSVRQLHFSASFVRLLALSVRPRRPPSNSVSAPFLSIRKFHPSARSVRPPTPSAPLIGRLVA